MSRHPDKKQLINYILDKSDKKAADLDVHLNECRDCRNFVFTMNRILRKSNNSSLAPSEQLENWILSLLNDSTYSNRVLLLRSLTRLLLRPAFLAAIILCSLAVLIIYNFPKSTVDSKELILSLLHNNGEISYNSELLQKHGRTINTGNIITNNNSSAVLELSSVFYLNIAENTELNINSAREISEKENTVYELDFDLKAGTIMAEWTAHNLRKTFTITTKYGRFEALGTSFILSERNLSRLAVLKGNVRVSLLKSDNTFIIKSGEGFICSNSFEKINIIPENEIIEFDKLFKKTITQDTLKQAKSKSAEPQKSEQPSEKKITVIDEDKQTYTEDKKKSIEELRKEKIELQKESKKTKKEMRKNLGSGSRSRR